MDKIRSELWEEIGNVVLTYVDDGDFWRYVYSGSLSYDDNSYVFSCIVEDEDNVDLKLDKIVSDDGDCEWKFIHWVESNWKINNEVVDDVDFRYDAQVFYSPVTQSCVWWTTLAEYDKMYEYAKVEYNIYDLEKDWKLFHVVKNSSDITGVAFSNIEQFLENDLVNKDIFEKLDYYKSWIVADITETVDNNGDINEDVVENLEDDFQSVSWYNLIYD